MTWWSHEGVHSKENIGSTIFGLFAGVLSKIVFLFDIKLILAISKQKKIVVIYLEIQNQ